MVRELYPNAQSFKAMVTERERYERVPPDIHVTVRICDSSGNPLVANGRTIEYYSTRPFVGMPQIHTEDVL